MLKFLLIDGLFFIAGLLMMEGLVKPLAAYLGRKVLKEILSRSFHILDPMMPALLQNGASTMKAKIIETFHAVAKDEDKVLNESDVHYLVKQFDNLFSPLVAASRIEQK